MKDDGWRGQDAITNPDDPRAFWNMVAREASIDELEVDDVVMLEEMRANGKGVFSRRLIRLTRTWTNDDGNKQIEFQDEHDHTILPKMTLVAGWGDE